MSRYFDAENVRKHMLENTHCINCADSDCFACLRKWIEEIPTADVVEVRHGEWIPCELKDGRDMVNLGYLKCSQCGDFGFLSDNNWGDWTGKTVTTYCPTCGAHMRNG